MTQSRGNAMSQHKRIFIIGHIGAGKGLLGKAVSEQLGWEFIDADLGLEARVGRYLAEIVGKPAGVQAFLECQEKILQNQLKKENIVVATDASLLDFDKNMKLLSSEFVVYLKVSTPIQIERLSRSSTTLLPKENYIDFLEAMHKERDSVYEKVSSLIIDSDSSDVNDHVLKIVHAISDENISVANEKIKLDRKDFILFHKTQYIPVHLSEQQARCLKLLAQGKSSKDIASKLNISHRTVEEYIAKIIEQLGCSSSKELIALYHDQP